MRRHDVKPTRRQNGRCRSSDRIAVRSACLRLCRLPRSRCARSHRGRSRRSSTILTAGPSSSPLASTALASWPPVGRIVAVVIAGLVFQVAHQFVLLCHTRRQARIAQSMVFDLRASLFRHLQNLSLAHHATGSAADSVYRLDADAGCLEALLLKGIFPLVFSAITLIVMFAILMRLDVTLALLSMMVIPCLYLSLRLSMARMKSRARSRRRCSSRR